MKVTSRGGEALANAEGSGSRQIQPTTPGCWDFGRLPKGSGIHVIGNLAGRFFFVVGRFGKTKEVGVHGILW